MFVAALIGATVDQRSISWKGIEQRLLAQFEGGTKVPSDLLRNRGCGAVGRRNDEGD